MKKIISIIFISLFVFCYGSSEGLSGEVNKDAVQAAMSDYIKAKTATGSGHYEIDGTETEFDYLHSGVKKKGELYVSCADFKTGGDVYDVDYFVSLKDGEYTVIKEVYHKKNGKKVNVELWSATE